MCSARVGSNPILVGTKFIYLIETVYAKRFYVKNSQNLKGENDGSAAGVRVLLNIILIKEDKMDDIDIGERIKKIVKLCL